MQLQHNYNAEEYGEEAQDRPCKYAFAMERDGILNVLHSPVLCRDFLNDTLAWIEAGVTDPEVEIYGYTYKGPIETDFTSLVIWDYGSLFKSVKALNKVELELGIEPTVVLSMKDPILDEDVAWVKGSKWWMTTTIHLAWYTTALRFCTYNQSVNSVEEFPTIGLLYNPETKEQFNKLPQVLSKLQVTQVRNSKEAGRYMHEYNGWHSSLDYYRHKFTVYGRTIREHLCKA